MNLLFLLFQSSFFFFINCIKLSPPLTNTIILCTPPQKKKILDPRMKQLMKNDNSSEILAE